MVLAPKSASRDFPQWLGNQRETALRAARRLATGHSMQRPRRPLSAAKKNTRLNFHRSMPGSELFLPHLLLRPRVHVEVVEHILAANQRRRFARGYLVS